MDYEDLLRWYCADTFSGHSDADAAYQRIKDWALANGHNIVNVINALCDDAMALINYQFVIY